MLHDKKNTMAHSPRFQLYSLKSYWRMRFRDLWWRHMTCTGCQRLAVVLDSLPNCIWIVTCSEVCHGCRETSGNIHNRKYLHHPSRGITLRARPELNSQGSYKLATCRPCVERLKSKQCKISGHYRKKKTEAFRQETLSQMASPPPSQVRAWAKYGGKTC